jgi:type I restriction enzyme S subunit
LERLAHAVFRAWLVDFEPVKAKSGGAASFPSMPKRIFDGLPSRLTESPIGLVPEGWAVKPLDHVVEVNPTRRLARGEVAPYLDMGQMPTDGHSPDAWVLREVGSGARFVNGDTLVARITPCLENGKTAFIDFLEDDEVAWGSTEYIVLRPNAPVPAVYAYLLARTPEFRSFAIQNMTGTSGRQRVPFDAMSKFHVAVPVLQSDLFGAFGHLVQPLFDRSRAAVRESQQVAALRDALMPQLISGAVRLAEGGGQ